MIWVVIINICVKHFIELSSTIWKQIMMTVCLTSSFLLLFILFIYFLFGSLLLPQLLFLHPCVQKHNGIWCIPPLWKIKISILLFQTSNNCWSCVKSIWFSMKKSVVSKQNWFYQYFKLIYNYIELWILWYSFKNFFCFSNQNSVISIQNLQY